MTDNKTKLDTYMDSELDLREILFVLYEKKISLILFTFIFGIIFFLYSLLIPNVYTSESTLEINNSSENQSNISSLTNQFGGLASIAGINIGSASPGDNSYRIIETLRSRQFSKSLSSLPNVKQDLFAADHFDPDTRLLTYDKSLFHNNDWVMDESTLISEEPTALEFHEKMHSMFKFDKNNETGFIEISFTHISPLFAKNFLDLVIFELNELFKTNDKKRASSSLEYLNSVIKENPIKDIKDSVSQLIKSNLGVLMISEIDEYYILRPLDPPHEPESKSGPSRFLMALIGAMVGFFIGSLVSLYQYYRKVS